MSIISLFLLSADEEVLQAIIEAAPEAAVAAPPCLASIGITGVASWLIIDPRSVGTCCLEELSTWRYHPRACGVIYLPLPADPEILLRLAQSYPGEVASLRQLPSLLKRVVAGNVQHGNEARQSWKERDRVLSPADRPLKARNLLEFARLNRQRHLTITEAAASLRLSTRQLERSCRTWLPTRLRSSLGS